jgi:hypothetical protein
MTSRVENYDEGLGPPDVYQRRDRDGVWVGITGHIQGDHPLNNTRGLGLGDSNEEAAFSVTNQDEGSFSTCPGGTLRFLLLWCISSRNSLDQSCHQGSLGSGGDITPPSARCSRSWEARLAG